MAGVSNKGDRGAARVEPSSVGAPGDLHAVASAALSAWSARPVHRRGARPNLDLSHTSAGGVGVDLPPIAERVILSLCDATGNWSRPYEEAGYPVRCIDLDQGGEDVRLLPFPGRVWGILAAPPCTVFCRLGSKRDGRTPAEYREALSIVDACLRLVAVCAPTWWALENPPGQLPRWLGPPAFKWHPCDFGDPWTKLTYLWGNFRAPSWRLTPECKPCLPVQRDHVRRTEGMRRSATPMGFSRAFFGANP